MTARKPKPPLEREVLGDCLKWLNLQPHIWAWRRNVAAVAVPVPGGPARWMRFGQKGMSDITGIIMLGELGIHLEVEVKRQGEEPTDHQRAWLAACATQGAVATWANSAAQLEAKLRGGFRRRGWVWGRCLIPLASFDAHRQRRGGCRPGGVEALSRRMHPAVRSAVLRHVSRPRRAS